MLSKSERRNHRFDRFGPAKPIFSRNSSRASDASTPRGVGAGRATLTHENHPANYDEDRTGRYKPTPRFQTGIRESPARIAESVGFHILAGDPRDVAAPEESAARHVGQIDERLSFEEAFRFRSPACLFIHGAEFLFDCRTQREKQKLAIFLVESLDGHRQRTNYSSNSYGTTNAGKTSVGVLQIVVNLLHDFDDQGVGHDHGRFLVHCTFLLQQLSHFLAAHLFPLHVLLCGQNGFHLRVRLLMDGAELVQFLHRRKRRILLQGLYLWRFRLQDRRELRLLLRR
jgi:hypothetical protein